MVACLTEWPVWMKRWVINLYVNLQTFKNFYIAVVFRKLVVGWELVSHWSDWGYGFLEPLSTVRYYTWPPALQSYFIRHLYIASHTIVQCNHSTQFSVSHFCLQFLFFFFVYMSVNHLETQWLLYIWKICIFSPAECTYVFPMILTIEAVCSIYSHCAAIKRYYKDSGL